MHLMPLFNLLSLLFMYAYAITAVITYIFFFLSHIRYHRLHVIFGISLLSSHLSIWLRQMVTPPVSGSVQDFVLLKDNSYSLTFLSFVHLTED